MNIAGDHPVIEYRTLFEQHVAGLRIQGHQGYGRCPLHEDGKASFSVNLETGLWTCHAGCGTGNARQFAERLGVSLPEATHRARMDREIIAIHEYNDDRGELLFQVVRFVPKDFRQRRPEGAGGWIWNLDGVRRVPYRLREVLAAVARGLPIFIVEGEKDADRLAGLGLVATTNPGGAGKWRDEDAPHFRGALVVILPDNDPPGERHMQQVAQSLFTVTAEVKVLRLPDLPPKGDVSDWLAAGHSVEELQRLAEEARPWRPPSQHGMPEDGYLGIAADFADLYGQHTEAPRPFLYFGFLTYLGCLVAPLVTLASELRPSPRLYTVCLGPSADGRKSSSLDHVDRFFRDMIAHTGDFVHYGLGSAEGLARRLGRDEDTKTIRPLLLHLDELRVLVDKSRPEGSIILPMLATLFERTVFDNTTKTHTISVRDGYLSLVAACTAETYAAIWTPSFLNIGFTNRLWLVTGGSDRRIALPASVPDTLRRAIGDDLGMLLARIHDAAGVLALRLDDDAAEAWNAWYQAMPRTIHSRRLDTYGWRLMILLSLSRSDLEAVRADTVRRVCALLDHQLALRQEFDPVDAENTIARMEEMIRRELRTRGPLGKRDLRRMTHADRYGIWTFNTALDNLQRAGDVRYDQAAKRFIIVEETTASV